ncbi:MAG: TonB-dependent receptor [Prolixibacteraceae bacterium]|nr:TonB-dependent receptor [Prolixibacteraceae bacterium]MBT7396593.1 TonB-dependent receptor [Prolixibacteraceae bacterium]
MFQQIEENSEFILLYNEEFVDVQRKVDVKVKNETVESVLDQVLEGTLYMFKIYDRQIVIFENENSVTPVLTEVKTDQPQNKEISGTVTDNEGLPLPGVSVVVKGTTTGTVTNNDGDFSFNIPNDAETLQFSFVGMKRQEVSIDDRIVFNIVMEGDAISIEEIVTVGYGIQKKINLTGSVSTVDAEDLENRPITNSSQALQGVQGIYVNQTGAQPGSDDATIRIRGIGTLNNNEPLVLIDGIESALRDINPNDIENISILKDASSASIYGNRAANGVILITTKRGKEGPLRVDYNAYFGWQQVSYWPDMVDDAVEMMKAYNQSYINEGQPQVYSDEVIEDYRNGTDPYVYPNTNWKDIMFSIAPMQEHYLSLSGGSDRISFLLSLGYLDQEGVFIGTDAQKYSTNLSVDFIITDRLKAGVNFSGTYWDRNEPASGMRSLMSGALTRSSPFDPPYAEDGSYGGSRLSVPGRTWRNSLAWATEGGTNTRTQRGRVHFNAEYTFPFNIIYKANFAVNKFDGFESTFIPELFYKIPPDLDTEYPMRMPDNRSAYRENIDNMDVSLFQTLEWSETISESHSIKLLGGLSRESFYVSNFDAYIEGFLSNELTELSAGSDNKDVDGTSSDSRLMSYFGRANYAFKDKYLLEINMRYDGSSRFAKGNRWGLFPSFSVGWRLGEEDFIKNIQSVNNLKFRASWGKLGNQSIPLFSYLNSVSLGQGYVFDNNVVAGAAIRALSDPDITWEKTTITNIGLDLGLWDNKLEIIGDIFDKETTDILARINLATQVGNLSGPLTNLYSMSNKGAEFGVNHYNSIGKINYKLGASVTYIKNNVESLEGDEQYGNRTTWGYTTIIKEGYPVNSFYLHVAEGIFQTQEEVDNHAFQHASVAPGDVKYKDINLDGVINVEDRIITGRSVPKYTYSFNLSLDYKGFDFSAFLQGVQGIDTYPTANLVYPNHNGANLTWDQLENSWTPDNPDASLPRLTLPRRGSRNNYLLSTFWLRDASYLRVKNLQIGYTIPSTLLDRFNIDSIRIFANGQNLLTFSDFKLTDPEREIIRQDIYVYPSSKVVSVGFNIRF